MEQILNAYPSWSDGLPSQRETSLCSSVQLRDRTTPLHFLRLTNSREILYRTSARLGYASLLIAMTILQKKNFDYALP